MLATQAQEFWGGRWRSRSRTRGAPTVRDVDAAFDRGEIVRSWTMRGTIHIIPARELAWVLSITGERQSRKAALVHRAEGIDAAELARAETPRPRRAAGGNGLARKDMFAVWEDGRRLDPGPAGLPPAVRAVGARHPVPGASGPACEWPDPRAVLRAAGGVGPGSDHARRPARGVLLPVHRLARPGRRPRLRVVERAAAGCLARGGGKGSRSPAGRR